MEPHEKGQALARKIATAVFNKLELTKQYDVVVRYHGEIVPLPWIDIAFVRIGKPIDTEFCLTLPLSRFLVETKEDSSELATMIYKNIAMMLGRLPVKGK